LGAVLQDCVLKLRIFSVLRSIGTKSFRRHVCNKTLG
jgi:hypothetical protein